ncbi:MAG TPA: hypothetical protein VFV07_13100, partial [Rhizomicrobium sp.]|nr:hypothetical protein [Rhizomicrobium sp.]
MDLIRFLAMLPVRAARWTRAFLADVLPKIFGRVAWTPPAWVGKALTSVRAKPREYLGATLSVIALVLGGYFGVQWYLSLPRPPEPDRITFEVQTPAITYYYDDAGPKTVIHSLSVKFSGSVAPLALVGKTVKSGITMDPALKGAWTWSDDRTLVFKPAQDWPVGLHEEVQFDPAQAFAAHVLVADDHFTFDMPGFSVSEGTKEFYQDPQNPAAKKTIMQLAFNYPVDPAELEKRIALKLRGRDTTGALATSLGFTVTYDTTKTHAWVHSEPLALPHDDDVVQLFVSDGVRSARGGDPTKDTVTMEVAVPGLYSLKVTEIAPTLVNNDRYEPEQVLVLTLSDAVKGSDLAASTEAWVLPKRKAGVKQAADDPPYDWTPDEVSWDVLKHSQKLKLELTPTEKEFFEVQSFKYHAEPGQKVFVHVNAGGMKSFGGYVFGYKYHDVVEVPDYPKLLHFMADGSLLSLSGDKRVSVVSRNVPGMKLTI